MTAPLPDHQPAKSGSSYVPYGLILVIGALVSLVATIIEPPMIEQLLFGWIYFPFRVLPQVTVDWPTVIVSVISMGIFIFGLHGTCIWFVRRPVSISGTARTWSIRSTLIVSLGLWMLFGAGTAMVAATHQTVWLITGRENKHSNVNAPRVSGIAGALREEANRTQFRNNQHQFGLAFLNAYDLYRTLPAGGTMTADGRLLHGWAISLGPYLGINNVPVDFAVPWNQPPNDRLYRCAVPVFLNPSVPEVFDADGYGLSHVAGNARVLPVVTVSDSMPGLIPGDQLFNSESISPASGRRYALDDITDGTAHTILVGEVATRFKPWGHPANVRDPAHGVNRSPDGFGSRSTSGDVLFLMCDGAVRRLSSKTDPSVMRALATPAEHDHAPVDF